MTTFRSLLILGVLAGPALTGCLPDTTSVDKGCTSNEDCVERMGPGSICEKKTRVCIDVSSSLGDLDATPTQDATR